MKKYVATREYGHVYAVVIDTERDYQHHLDPRLDMVNHSPTGFEFGYAGSGPAQLALAILADHFDVEPGVKDHSVMCLHQRFKRTNITPQKGESFEITSEEISDWIGTAWGTGTMTREDLEGFDSMITIRGSRTCLGDLFFAEGKGCFCPDNGRVPVSKEESEAHNTALDTARIEGLDNNCEVGMRGCFYYHKAGSEPASVKTFMGTVVSDDIYRDGRTIEFRRNDMTFRGELSREHDLFEFERVR